jgi:hypothetical protein
MDAVLRMPHGCFEQTSSTTYASSFPNSYENVPVAGYEYYDLEVKSVARPVEMGIRKR